MIPRVVERAIAKHAIVSAQNGTQTMVESAASLERLVVLNRIICKEW
jgi:hypothetical protein